MNKRSSGDCEKAGVEEEEGQGSYDEHYSESDSSDGSDISASSDGDSEESSVDSESNFDEDWSGRDEAKVYNEEANLKALSWLEADNTDTSDEEELRDTLGNIPLQWYDDYTHYGYDQEGRSIPKLPSAATNEVEDFLAKMEDPHYWRTIKNRLTGKEVVLTDEQVDMIYNLQKSCYPEHGVDAYAPYIDHFSCEKEKLPLSSAPKPKSSFIPSKWEHRQIVKLVHSIRMGYLKPHPPPKPDFYQLWREGGEEEVKGKYRMHIPAPRMKLPGHAESYNPPPEYLPNQCEEEEWLAAEEEDRSSNYLPHKYNCLRDVPAYSSFIKERFERCLDLYLCPRQHKMRVNVDPEDLIPKLPPIADLQPFPTTEVLVYRGHSGLVQCIAVEVRGQWLASASADCSVRLWEVATGRCMRTLTFVKPPLQVAFSPNKQQSLLAIVVGEDVVMVNTGLGDSVCVRKTAHLLQQSFPSCVTAEEKGVSVEWIKCASDEVRLRHVQCVKHMCWHGKGDYFSTVLTNSDVYIHQLSKARSQKPFRTVKGQVQVVLFHPFKHLLFVATQTSVKIYDLVRQELVKRLLSGVKWISSMTLHPSGDHLLLASYDKKTCWFDLDLSSKPYKVLRQHKGAVRCISVHQTLPLFATCGDDGRVVVTHGKIYNDLLKNPQIVPVKQLHASSRVDGLGVLWCEFHPTQPWIFTAGADTTIRLFSN